MYPSTNVVFYLFFNTQITDKFNKLRRKEYDFGTAGWYCCKQEMWAKVIYSGLIDKGSGGAGCPTFWINILPLLFFSSLLLNLSNK